VLALQQPLYQNRPVIALFLPVDKVFDQLVTMQ
jgi:hypothetical protein